MYFGASQYPVLAHLSSTDRRRTVAAALRSQNPWVARRLVIAFFLGAVIAGALSWFAPAWHLPDWSASAVALFDGLLFYAYMLWEVNGPIFLAVEKHVSSLQTTV